MLQNRTLPILVLLIFALACNALAGAGAAPPAAATSVSIEDEFSLASATRAAPSGAPPGLVSHTGRIQADVTYCTVDGTQLKMDLYFPKAAQGLLPAVAYVHGGGWIKGDKAEPGALLDFPALLDAGFILASLNYRLGPQYKFPDMIEDVKCAIRYLRANAGQLHLDPNRIGAEGASAGGHLVSLLGVAGSSAGFDVGQYADQSSGVQAVADLFGPEDLPAFFATAFPNLRTAVFGSFDLAKASPVTYVRRGDPPFLILHGDADHVVPFEQSSELDATLTAAGVDATLITVHNGPHGLTAPDETPARADLTALIVKFFEKALK
jgi:acetyl esterase/lipase